MYLIARAERPRKSCRSTLRHMSHTHTHSGRRPPPKHTRTHTHANKRIVIALARCINKFASVCRCCRLFIKRCCYCSYHQLAGGSTEWVKRISEKVQESTINFVCNLKSYSHFPTLIKFTYCRTFLKTDCK